MTNTNTPTEGDTQMKAYQVVIGSGVIIADSIVSLAYAKSIVAGCHPVVKARIVEVVLK